MYGVHVKLKFFIRREQCRKPDLKRTTKLETADDQRWSEFLLCVLGIRINIRLYERLKNFIKVNKKSKGI